MKKFLKEFRIELIVLAIVVIGILLLFERLPLRWYFRSGSRTVSEWFQALGSSAAGYLSRLSFSDLLGWLLIFGFMAFLLWRVRYRFTTSDHWLAADCPKCGSKLHRVHRTQWDRLVSVSLKPHAHRYACANDQCLWTGLRRSNSHSSASLQTQGKYKGLD